MTPEIHAAVERLRALSMGDYWDKGEHEEYLADLALLAAAVDAGARERERYVTSLTTVQHALATATARVQALEAALHGAPMERLDTHGWIECVWCHAIRETFSAPTTLVHDPACGVLRLRALLQPEAPRAAGGAKEEA